MNTSQHGALDVALALGAGFAARTFAGDSKHIEYVMKEAVNYKGFALVDILQPCVTFNKKNTYSWYRENTAILDDSYDPGNLEAAVKTAAVWGKEIPMGIIYKRDMLSYEDQLSILKEDTLINQSFKDDKISMQDFFISISN